MKTFEQFIDNEVTFEIINADDFNFIINEEWDWKYDFYLKDNKEKLKISEEDRVEFIEIEKNVKDYIDEINPFWGHFINNQNKTIKYQYNINVTEHYITKFLRKDFEDPTGLRGFLNPDLHTGIDLIYKNKNNLTRFISTNAIKEDSGTLVKILDNSRYSEIFKINRIDKGYDIVLISQMKGKEFIGFQGKIIKLHPFGDR